MLTCNTNYNVFDNHVKADELWLRGGFEWNITRDLTLKSQMYGYGAKREARVLDAPFVRLVMPGVFEHWLRFHKKWGGQQKTPRCRSDRLVADELAAITHFAGD